MGDVVDPRRIRRTGHGDSVDCAGWKGGGGADGPERAAGQGHPTPVYWRHPPMFGLLALLSPIHLTPQSPPRHVLLIRRWGLGRLYSSLRMNAHPGSSANACDGREQISGPEARRLRRVRGGSRGGRAARSRRSRGRSDSMALRRSAGAGTGLRSRRRSRDAAGCLSSSTGRRPWPSREKRLSIVRARRRAPARRRACRAGDRASETPSCALSIEISLSDLRRRHTCAPTSWIRNG